MRRTRTQLVQVYFDKRKGIYMLSCRSGDGPHKTCGEATKLPYDVAPEVLGEEIERHYAIIPSLTAMDDNLEFYKKIPGIRSWRQFLKHMGLISISKTDVSYRLTLYVKKNNYYEGDGIHDTIFDSTVSAAELGTNVKHLMLQSEEPEMGKETTKE